MRKYTSTQITITHLFKKGIDTMKEKKMTKKDRYNQLLAIADVKANKDLVDFINHELELLDRKNASDKKPTAQQVANEGVKEAIIEGMEKDRLYTITEIQKNIPACNDLSNQRVSALVRQLKDEGKVVRTEDKRKAYFSLA